MYPMKKGETEHNLLIWYFEIPIIHTYINFMLNNAKVVKISLLPLASWTSSLDLVHKT